MSGVGAVTQGHCCGVGHATCLLWVGRPGQGSAWWLALGSLACPVALLIYRCVLQVWLDPRGSTSGRSLSVRPQMKSHLASYVRGREQVGEGLLPRGSVLGFICKEVGASGARALLSGIVL